MSGPTRSAGPASLTCLDYTVACICPLGVELAPVEAMLDEVHPNVDLRRKSYAPRASSVENAYTLGRIGGYNVVIAAMPRTGNNVAATVTTMLHNDFPFIRYAFLVGIGGGVPGIGGVDDVRLGDIVVGLSAGTAGAVIQCDLGKRLHNSDFQSTGLVQRPPDNLCAQIERLKALHHREGSKVPHLLDQMLHKYPLMVAKYTSPGSANDCLFKASYPHAGTSTCERCSPSELVVRSVRASSDPVIHYGRVGSSNAVIKDGVTRDSLKQRFGLICVDMEAAGLMDAFPGLVIRGICDYADSHKNKQWQPYAAAVAAAYLKELLLILPSNEIAKETGEFPQVENNHREEGMSFLMVTWDLLRRAANDYTQRLGSMTEFVMAVDMLTTTEVIWSQLSFSRMDDRYEGISDTYGDTFRWILHDDRGSNNGLHGEQPQELHGSHQKTREKFVSWLREGSGIFWVSGKAGSGKSTLMKLIRQDKETEEHLRYWARDTPFFIGHFYFHDRGDNLEKSEEGLMRSVLYQLLTHHPHLTKEAFGFLWDRMRRLCQALLSEDATRSQQLTPEPGFAKSELLTAFASVLEKTVGRIRLCLFIDGLDEYQGHDRDIITLMGQILTKFPAKSDWHKLCVSSRPHAAFEEAYSVRPSLRMQDLTYNDIYHYVHSQLRPSERRVGLMGQHNLGRFNVLVARVVQQAQGVFLWVRLAVASLLDGLEQSDWIHELEERVNALPPELESFYERMVRMIAKKYRPQAARIFQILLGGHLDKPVILSFLENSDQGLRSFQDEDYTFEALNQRCCQMELRLKYRFGGLIEIYSSPLDWTKSRAEFFHQTVREYFQRPDPWRILAEGCLPPGNVPPPARAMALDYDLYNYFLKRARKSALLLT
ncbi:hypothetical protein PV11_03206 [Exophiala sideris]|uniref:Nucleoside phosphorylase domain-containing protein n=1 Tax=Exophiala sideris TaxID=1016849 RepID=A0A0D1WFX8_9EURO|nr:hypothetical protein PV11_03206 [Exophiala sideris]